MFSKSKVSQSMIDAVNKVLGEQPVEQKDELLNEASPIKEPTSGGMKVYGRSYGNSAKAKQDQTKSAVDTIKGPKDKEMKEAAKPDFLDMDKDGDKKEPMKKAVADKEMKEELKGNQHKIDANNNNKIDSQDFEILRGKKKVKEDMSFAARLLESVRRTSDSVRRSDIPAYIRKAQGAAPLTPAEVKAPPKDSISHPDALAKARGVKEEAEQIDEISLQTMKSAKDKLQDKAWDAHQDDNKYGERHYKGRALNMMDKIKQKERQVTKEDVEQLDELSSDALKSYVNKAKPELKVSKEVRDSARQGGDGKTANDMYQLAKKRTAGIKQAKAKLNKEEVEQIEEKNVPTSPEKWARAKSAAKSKFDVYPSAYANGWASKKYKAMGGGWKSVSEELTEEQVDEIINEVLGKDASAGDYIHDFVHSDNPKFAGKSKAERKKMALGAYYGKQDENYQAAETAVTTDTLAGRMPGGKVNSFLSYKLRVRPLDKEGEQMTKAPEDKKLLQTPAMKSHEVHEATMYGTPGWKTVKKDITDKSGAIHTPMSRAKDLAKQAFKKVQDKTKIDSGK